MNQTLHRYRYHAAPGSHKPRAYLLRTSLSKVSGIGFSSVVGRWGATFET